MNVSAKMTALSAQSGKYIIHVLFPVCCHLKFFVDSYKNKTCNYIRLVFLFWFGYLPDGVNYVIHGYITETASHVDSNAGLFVCLSLC